MTRRKRLTAPKAWSIPRKGAKWVVNPSPGPHPVDRCLPLLLVLRDVLHHCDNAREAKSIVRGRQIRVDGRVVTDPGFPLGLMDTLSLPAVQEHFRVLVDTRGRFQLLPIPETEAGWKLVRIENKTALRGGRLQLNLSDGRNLLAENGQATRDTLQIAVPDQKILDTFPFQKGSVALLVGGKHVGRVGHVEEVRLARSMQPTQVTFQEGFSTIRDYVFVVGKEKPVIGLPETAGGSP